MSSSLGSSGSGSEVNKTPAVTDKSELTGIMNQNITKMEDVSRPLDSSGSSSSAGSAASAIAKAVGIEHGAIKATTGSGDEYLIQKGKDFGNEGGNTIVVPASDMSGEWKTNATREMGDKKMTIGDAVKLEGKGYQVGNDNCNIGKNKVFNHDK